MFLQNIITFFIFFNNSVWKCYLRWTFLLFFTFSATPLFGLYSNPNFFARS